MTEDTVPTLQARMGTGGNNTPMVAYEPTQDPAGTITTNGFRCDLNKAENGHLAVAFDEMNFRTTEMHQTLRAGTPQSTGAVVPPATVRRLTPTECERLQGFPDGWTAERIDETKGLIPQADSHRYKQMGNAVAVPVVEWIVDRLVTYENNH